MICISVQVCVLHSYLQRDEFVGRLAISAPIMSSSLEIQGALSVAPFAFLTFRDLRDCGGRTRRPVFSQSTPEKTAKKMIRYERESTDITLWNRQVGAHLLEQISHLDLHVFYHLSDVSNMRRELLEGMILFNLLLPDQPSLFFLHQSSVHDRPKHEKKLTCRVMLPLSVVSFPLFTSIFSFSGLVLTPRLTIESMIVDVSL